MESTRLASIAAVLALALVLLPGPAPGQQAPRAAARAADGFLAPEAAAPAELQEENATVKRIEALRAKIAADRAEVLGLEQKAREATRFEEAGLRSQAFEKRVQSMRDLRALVDLVATYEKEGGDASQYRQPLSELLGTLVPAIAYHLKAGEKALREAAQERDSAAPGDRMEAEQRFTRQSRMVGELLRVAVDLVVMQDELSMDSTRARELASSELSDRLQLTAGRIEGVKRELTDARERLKVAPNDEGVQSAIRALESRLDADSKSLASDLSLASKLGIETTKYKQLLIQSTGEISSDVFDIEVAKGLIRSWLSGLRDGVIESGPRVLFKLVTFAIVLAVFWLIAGVARRVTSRAVGSDRFRMSELLKRMLVSAASGSVKILGVLVALSQLGIEVGPLLAGLGIAGFIVGFALQDTLANFAAGAMILAYRPYDVGDIIDCASGVFGKVGSMNLVSTTILTFDNQTKVVPNGKIWGDVITNVTAQRIRRVDLTFGIAYGDDIDHAEKILRSLVESHDKILENPEPLVKLHELGDSSVNFVVRPWVARDDYWDVYWDLTRAVKLRFDREGISIPFPQRDVHHFYPSGLPNASIPEAPRGASQTAPHERTAESSHTEADSDD